jgi:hypothetical protein
MREACLSMRFAFPWYCSMARYSHPALKFDRQDTSAW